MSSIQPKILVGDCIQQMRALPDQSVHTCVTSPPYFGLRDYGMDGQIGLEDTPEAFVARLVEVFREVRRVLRDDGTLWMNLGDSYARAGGWSDNHGLSRDASGFVPERGQSGRAISNFSAGGRSQKVPDGYKQKDLLGIPWRAAFALQADGWYLRQEIIWHKPNGAPERMNLGRCAKAHEHIFLLAKSSKYYFDGASIAACSLNGSSKAKPSVWSVPVRSYRGAHFATFPPDLIEPCILAGAPAGGVVLDPFGGSGTTAGVALKHGRQAILCELNPEYAALIPGRVEAISGSPVIDPTPHDNDNTLSPFERLIRSIVAA
ncbi:DNA-methyltransferase [Allorhizobium pseudoryzae]|uniref:DNA-methyltransferase n=1 Tax=Allorhizobium pseudoryzae TaxID=379684 RepID=UPI003D08850A